MGRFTYYVTDAQGFLVREGSEERSDWTDDECRDSIAARQAAGRTVLDASNAERPAERPPSAAETAFEAKSARLTALRVKGWAALAPSERDEARALAFDLGIGAPPA